MKRKIMFLVASLGIGGAQKIAAFVMNACVSKYSISVYSLSNDETNVDIDSQIKVYYASATNSNKLFEKAKEIIETRNIIRKVRPDLVIIFGSYSFPAIGTVLSGTKIMGCERGDPYTYTKVRKIINKALYKKYAYSVFQSEGACKFYSIDKQRSCVICNPCFPVEISGIEKENVICAAGRLSEDKGFDTLLDAFKEIENEFPEYKLIIYGDGPYKGVLQRKISNLELADKVVLYGKVKHLPDYLQKAKLFVLASWYEGLPNVLIEAMSVGTPIVATDCSPGGARFLMNGGKRGGIIVPVKSASKMADAMRVMLTDTEFSNSMGEKGKEILDLYSPDTIAKQWNEVIEDVLKEQ